MENRPSSGDVQDSMETVMEELESDMELISLEATPELDANVSQMEECKRKDIIKNEATSSSSKYVAPTSPQFTRSWSFTNPAQDRKVHLSNLRTKNSSNMKIDVQRALNRSWSFTKTARSPLVGDAKVSEFIAIDEDKETLQGVDVARTPMPPMPPITEDYAAGIDEQEEQEEEEKEKEAKDVKPVLVVTPLSKSVVVPSEPTENYWLHLSNLDRVVNPTFSSVIHYYKDVVTATCSFSDVTSFLKKTLANTLVEFYPLAGRLMLGDDGKVDLNCNAAGAVWIEANVNAELQELGGPQPNHLLSGFDTARLGSGPLYIPDQITPMPVLVIQCTKFSCGTIAIATSWHHTVADGFSGTHFMRSWAEVAQGKPISLKPVHSRNILNARNPPNPTLVNGYSTQSLEDLLPEAAKVSTSAPAQLEKFNLNKDAIAQLKKTANVEPPPFTPRPYTSAESISAHLWRQMTKARATANSYDELLAKDQTTKFFMFVDGRKRLRLPGGYFGNVVCSACAVAKEADILTKPLHYAASLIRVATRNITEEYFRSLIDWVEVQGMSSSKSEHVNSLGHDVAATFWTFFPLYEIEFGWGKPVFAARNSPPRPLIDGIAMMPSAGGQGMVALLNLHSDRMSKLQRQISFATVFH